MNLGKGFSIVIMASLAGCSALGGLGSLIAGVVGGGATEAPVINRRNVVNTPAPTMTPAWRPGDQLTMASPTAVPTPYQTTTPSDDWVATPAPIITPYPCEALDGTKPVLRGEIVTLLNGERVGRLYIACRGTGREMANGGPRDFSFNQEIPTDAAAFGVVDKQLYVQVKGVVLNTYFDWTRIQVTKHATFRRTGIKDNTMSFELVKNEHYAGDDKHFGWFTPGWKNLEQDSHPIYVAWTKTLPGSPISSAGDVASVSYDANKNWGYDKVLLTPNAEARWGAATIDFGCAPFEGHYVKLEYGKNYGDLSYKVTRKTSIGQQYVLFMREGLTFTGPIECRQTSYGGYLCSMPFSETLHHGAWILTKGGRWYKSKIFGAPVNETRWEDAEGMSPSYGIGTPVWDEELGGFVTTLTRTEVFRPELLPRCGSCAYQPEKLNAAFRLVTEDEIEKSLEPTGGCRAGN